MNIRCLKYRPVHYVTGLLLAASVCSFTGSSDQKKNGEAEAWAGKTLAGLSLEKKAAQLVCTDISGLYVPEDDHRFESWIKLAGEYGVGGFVLYGGTPQNVAALLNRLQKEAEIPLLISADFEGGPGQQVAGASEFPGNMAFAAAGDKTLMYEAAKIMAEEGRAMGIHLTYTPVTDISLSPENPQESVRSFGGDIDLNGRLLKAYVKGFHEGRMLTTAKHFPGRGDMKALPDFPGFNYLAAPAASIRENEFRAFQYAVDAGVDFIMTEHLAVPSVTEGSLLPSSVEPRLVTGVIRNQLNFKGIITTDDLWYDYVINRFGAEEVAIKALEAGHDIVLKPKDPVATIQAIVNAVKSGRITEARLNQSVYKLLVIKAKLGLHKSRMVDAGRIGQIVGTIAHQKIVQQVADRSVTLLRNDGVFPLKSWDPRKAIHISVQKDDDMPAVKDLSLRMTGAFEGITNFILKPGLGEPFYHEVIKAVNRADHVILSFFVQRTRHGDPAPLRDQDLKLIQQIIASQPGKVIAMSFGNPHLINKMTNIPAFLTGYGESGWYGNQPVYFDSFIRILKGELNPTGKLPLLVSEDFPIGYGLTY